MSFRIGIDVGGTNTDAILMNDEHHILAKTKSTTTADVSTGIDQAMRNVVVESGVDQKDIKFAMLGTTHCTNAILERHRLNTVSVIRIGAPATVSVKPLVGVPEDLKQILDHHTFIVRGGHNFDGTEIVQLDEDELYRIANEIKGKVDSVAVTSPFSPILDDHESQAASILHEVLGDRIPVTLSHEIGSLGLLERENATILNAALIDVAKKTADGFVDALKKEGIEARVYFSQNDGTQMTIDYAIRFPVLTIACGPSNGIRGSSFLSGLSDALVVDVGGTSTDVGVLVDSFPRESSLGVEIGGVQTNFRMPDIGSMGLGGGTIVHIENSGDFTVGPDSVGYQLSQKALVFGGSILTTTDVAVALEKADVGDPQKVKHLDKGLMKRIYQHMTEMFEEAIDKMKTSPKAVPVILIGGGSILIPDEIKGVSQVIQPNHFEVASGIGSAIAQVGGQMEGVYNFDQLNREQALKIAENKAIKEAISAGANSDTVKVVDMEDVPLTQLGNTSKIKIKAVGDLVES